MKEAQRRIIITGNAPVIRDAISVLLASVESEDGTTPGPREELQRFSKQNCHNLILDLREVGEPFGETPAGIKNFCVNRVGGVLVVNCEIDTPRIFQQIEQLCRPHLPTKQLATGLVAFIHILF
jgi:hypothetical protein